MGLQFRRFVAEGRRSPNGGIVSPSPSLPQPCQNRRPDPLAIPPWSSRPASYGRVASMKVIISWIECDQNSDSSRS